MWRFNIKIEFSVLTICVDISGMISCSLSVIGVVLSRISFSFLNLNQHVQHQVKVAVEVIVMT
jgi:hypothetical protein